MLHRDAANVTQAYKDINIMLQKNPPQFDPPQFDENIRAKNCGPCDTQNGTVGDERQNNRIVGARMSPSNVQEAS